MCNYKTLHHNEHGYVVKCNTCKNIQVAFGTTAVAYTEQEFYEFKTSVYEYYNHREFDTCPDFKNNYFKTPTPKVMLVYNLTEVKNLNSLLEEAYIGLEVEKLIEVN